MGLDFDYSTLAGVVAAAEDAGVTISEVVLAQQAEELQVSKEELFEQMRDRLAVMDECIEPGCDPELRSTSGLTGGDAAKMRAHLASGAALSGGILGGALVRALAVSGLNAAMGRIVAAPTAGSCGILPAAVLTMRDERGASERDCVMSLFTAAGVGLVIEHNACLAGAQGGCQAECGSAAAMAAAALVELAGGSPVQASDAVSLALQNVLGLVCDPVAGLVEIPCIKRNAGGVAGAIVAADLALAGAGAEIPADEAIEAMGRVGAAMPASLRETAEGGIATTPTARALAERVFGSGASAAADGSRGRCVACGACR